MAFLSCIEKYYLKRSLISYLLYPFSLIFSIILIIRRFAYKKILPQYRAPVFVISIGNMIAGGSGKTPFTIYIAQLLKQKGFRVAVSHRGYKSEIENRVTIISDIKGLLPDADKAGDEAWLIAKRLAGIPVVAGKNRTQAIQLLCNTYPDLEIVILDDSFQHLKVKHDLDIIIVSSMLGFGNGFVLPAGYLREPLSAIKDADLLILNRQSSQDEMNHRLVTQMAKIDKQTLSGNYQLEKLHNFEGQEVALEDVTGDKVIMTSGIGNPNGFKDMVKDNGLILMGGILFKDHYSFQDKSSRANVLRCMKERQAKWVAVTEKDYAKLRFYPEFKDCLLVFPIRFNPRFQEQELLEKIRLPSSV